MKTKVKENQKGITLIALVITIIVLLILASVSIAMLTGDNGILTRAGDAKIETAVGAVKEQIGLYQIEKKMNKQDVTAESLLAEGKVSRTVQLGEADKYYMYYALKENSFEGMQGLGKGNIASLKDVFLIDDNLNVKYISSNGKEYGDNLNNKVLDDETEIRFSSKAFSEYVSKISGISEKEMKFKWMKNQTSLTIADTEIDSLQDLVFFPKLETLQLGNSYNEIAPNIISLEGIENCTKLSTLKIYYGPDKDYTAMSKLNNLNSFYKQGGSDFESIINGLKYCRTLKSLDLRNIRNIKSMKRISELGNLEKLLIRGSNLSKIEGLKNQTNLKYLDLAVNNITEVKGLETLSNLENLYLSYNKIIDITPLCENSLLKLLDLRGNNNIDGNRENYTVEELNKLNEIGEILDRQGEINLDIDKLGLFTNYKKLNLSGQNLITLENLEGLTKLESLNLGFNNINLEDEKSKEILGNMTKLKYLDLSYNKVTDISSINNLKNLTHLYLNNNEKQLNLKQIEDIISNLESLYVTTESLKTILNCDMSKISKLNIPGGNLTEIPDLSKFKNLSILRINKNPNIANFNEITNIPSLKNLELRGNNLHGRMIDFSKLTNLTKLDLSDNTLWSEDLENLKALKNNINLTINLSNNSIIDATALLELDSSTKINLSNNVNLSQDSKDKLKAKFGNKVTF